MEEDIEGKEGWREEEEGSVVLPPREHPERLEHALGFSVPTPSLRSSSPFLFLPGPL